MTWAARLLNTVWRRDDVREAIAEELLFRLEEKTRANVKAGMTPAEAREQAMRTVGDRVDQAN